jgi:hypothetical protein
MKIGIIGAGALTQPSLRWPASMAAMAPAGSRRRCEGLAQRPDQGLAQRPDHRPIHYHRTAVVHVRQRVRCAGSKQEESHSCAPDAVAQSAAIAEIRRNL